MMRMLRRALRQWKSEFLAFWGRFTAFHRIVIGIIMAMSVAYAARSHMLDPVDRELVAARKALVDKKIPARVPLPEQDEVIQEETLREENLRRSLENRSAELAGIESGSMYRLNAGKAEANAALLAIISRHGLRALRNAPTLTPVANPVPASSKTAPIPPPAGNQNPAASKNTPTPAPVGNPIPVASEAYEMAGHFAAIYGFLADMEREPLLWELRGVSITLLNGGDTPGGGTAPPLVLRFTLILHLYRGGGA